MGRTTFIGVGVGATLQCVCTWAGAGSWTSRGRSPPHVVGLLVKGCHWPWMLGLSVWKGLRMRIMSKPDWFASFCTSVVISSTDLQLMLSSRTAPLTGRREMGVRGGGPVRRQTGGKRAYSPPPPHTRLADRPPATARLHSRYSATTLGTEHGRGFTYITTPGFRRAKSATSRSTNSLRNPRKVSTVTPDRAPSARSRTPHPSPAHLAPRDEGASRLRLKLRRCSCCT